MEQTVATDTELIQRCRDGDHDAFDMLYHRYRLQLYSYLNRFVPGQADVADDLFQQTWIKVLDNLDRYREQQKFISWLFRIAHNVAIDHIRRESNMQKVELTEQSALQDNVPWEDMDRDTLMAAVEKATGELSPEQREVLTLRQQGMTFKDIAGIQKASINTVLGRMHYAVKNLRQLLSAYAWQ